MRQARDFRPSRWLPGPQGQTLWAQMARSRRLVDFEREHLETPDGDELILDHLAGPRGSPRLILLHGLEGSSFSAYAQGLAVGARRLGLAVTVLNFRSCARRLDDRRSWIPNRRPRLYHSGETGDLDLLLETLGEREPEAPLVAAGVSLGGNVLLKWLGEHPGQERLVAAATVSVPYDLGACAEYLRRPIGRVYVGHFVRTLAAKLAHLKALFPEAPVDLERARRARDFVTYDDAATAPLHGFAGADDYYRRSSSIGFLERITTPTLCLSAVDDPFLPPSALDEARRRAPAAVDLRVTARGGHVGFVEGLRPGRASWAEERVLAWLDERLADR